MRLPFIPFSWCNRFHMNILLPPLRLSEHLTSCTYARRSHNNCSERERRVEKWWKKKAKHACSVNNCIEVCRVDSRGWSECIGKKQFAWVNLHVSIVPLLCIFFYASSSTLRHSYCLHSTSFDFADKLIESLSLECFFSHRCWCCFWAGAIAHFLFIRQLFASSSSGTIWKFFKKPKHHNDYHPLSNTHSLLLSLFLPRKTMQRFFVPSFYVQRIESIFMHGLNTICIYRKLRSHRIRANQWQHTQRHTHQLQKGHQRHAQQKSTRKKEEKRKKNMRKMKRV